MPLSLLIVDPEGTAKHWPLRPGPIRVGRGQANDLVIVGRGVSRLHVVLTLEGEDILVEDQDSTYGTKVNGRQLRTAKVGVGDHIDIGVFRLVVVPSADHIEEAASFDLEPSASPTDPEEGRPQGRWDEPTVALLTTSEYALPGYSPAGSDPQATALFRTDEAHGLRRIEPTSEKRGLAQAPRRPPVRAEAAEPRRGAPATPQMLARVEGLSRALAGSPAAPANAADLTAVLLVAKTAERLSRSPDLGTFLDEALDLLLADLKVHTAMLVRRDELGKLKAITVRHPGGATQAEIPLSRSVVDEAMRTGRPVQSKDLQADPTFGVRDSVMASRAGALLAVPLFTGDQAEGAVCLFRRAHQPFDPAEVEAVTGVAGLLGRALSLRDLEKRAAEERRKRLLLERFHSPEVVEQLYEKGGSRELQNQLVTALYVEITHFEKFLERTGCTRAADLAEAFRALTHAAVFGNGGTLVWLHEDAGLALFGGQGTAESDAAWALAAASEMLREWGNLATSFSLPQKITLRIGLDRGTLLRGLLGPTERLQVTALGAPVVRARDAARAGAGNSIHASITVLEQVPSPRGQVQRLEPDATGLDQAIYEITL